jgi:signal peptidase II
MRYFSIFLLTTLGVFMIDQNIKALFVSGYFREGSCIDLVLHYNKGVAFSMLTFLGPYLKWIQLAIIVGVLYVLFAEQWVKTYAFCAGLFIGGALGNLYDRFVHPGVVDYVAWHCGFNFAVFNFADVMIDMAIVIFLLRYYVFKVRA